MQFAGAALQSIIRTFRQYAYRLRRFRQILESVRPDVLVLAEDNVGHMTGVFTTLGRQSGASVLVIPYTIANAREFAESYFSVPEHQLHHWPNALVAKRYPHWVHRHHGRRLMRMPGWHVLAQEWFDVAPPAPWTYHSGYADAILVESQRTVEYYSRAGLPRQQMLALGSMTDDQLAADLERASTRREMLFEQLELPAGQPLLLTALPPNQLPSRPRCGYRDFDQLLRDWLRPLAEQRHFSVVVRLHPRLERRNLQYIEREFGLRISELDTATLVALCDVYVASVSATIRWAAACGKPVVNYDIYKYRYDDYDGAPGILTMQSHQEYEAAIRRLATEPAYLQQLVAVQQADRENWGRLDGQSGRRILNAFDYFTSQSASDDYANCHHRPGTNGTATRADRPSVAA